VANWLRPWVVAILAVRVVALLVRRVLAPDRARKLIGSFSAVLALTGGADAFIRNSGLK